MPAHTANEALQSRAITRQLFLQRFKSHEAWLGSLRSSIATCTRRSREFEVREFATCTRRSREFEVREFVDRRGRCPNPMTRARDGSVRFVGSCDNPF